MENGLGIKNILILWYYRFECLRKALSNHFISGDREKQLNKKGSNLTQLWKECILGILIKWNLEKHRFLF